jgi:hypothetical protein
MELRRGWLLVRRPGSISVAKAIEDRRSKMDDDGLNTFERLLEVFEQVFYVFYPA